MRKITIKGKGTITYKPDWMEINITIKSVGLSRKKALEEISTKIGRLIDCINEQGLDAANLRTISMTTENVDDLVVSEIEGKKAEKGVKITQKYKIGIPFEIINISKVVYELLYCGIYPEIMLVQTVKDKDRIKEELVRSAVVDAKKKAKAMAKELGVELGKVVSIAYTDKPMDDEQTVSKDFFDYSFSPILCGGLFGYRFLPEEMEISDEVEVIWKLI